MVKFVPGYESFGVDILKILDIDYEYVKSLTLKIEADDIVRVDVERLIYGPEATKILNTMKENYTFDVKKK